MVDPDALRYLRIAQADLDEAQRMVELSVFRDSSIGFRLQQACEKSPQKLDPHQGRPGSLHPRPRRLDGLAEGIGYRCQRVRDDTVELISPDWPLLLGITVSLLEQVQGDLT
jgi:hypothetical protein